MNARCRSLILAVAVSGGCGGALPPTGPAPTPAPSRADQDFLAIGYSCELGNDASRRFSIHEIDPTTGLFRAATFSPGTPGGGILDLGPHRADGRLLYASRYAAGNRPNETIQVQSLDATGALHSVGERALTPGRWYGPGR